MLVTEQVMRSVPRTWMLDPVRIEPLQLPRVPGVWVQRHALASYPGAWGFVEDSLSAYCPGRTALIPVSTLPVTCRDAAPPLPCWALRVHWSAPRALTCPVYGAWTFFTSRIVGTRTAIR